MNLFERCKLFYKLATEVSGVKSFRQTPGFCGAASLHIVMDFYGKNISEDELAKLSRTSRKLGTEAPDMLDAANHVGFDGFYLDNCELSDIKRWLKMGFPIIVDWFSTNEGHFSVAFKIDNKNIYLQDPELGKSRKIPLEEFSNIWFDFKEPKQTDLTRRRMIVIYPKDKKPELSAREKQSLIRKDFASDTERKKILIDKKHIFTFKNFKFCLVYAEYIRNNVDIDFVAGGNPARYQYVPKDEIWIESSVSMNDIAATALHEFVECVLMDKKHMSYDDAHDLASKVEIKLRKKFDKSLKIRDYEQIKNLLQSLIK